MRVTEATQAARGEEIIGRCREIAACTDVAGEITRTFLSAAMHEVHTLLGGWMTDAGMAVEIDAVGNLRGVYPGSGAGAARLIIGSHLDTIPNAGAFDGVLGVVLGIALVEGLQGRQLPFAIEVVGFSEEEGVRFSKPFLGSMALVGLMDAETLKLKDGQGVSVGEAIRGFGLDPAQMAAAVASSAAFGYLEMHIEQGPVLESLDRQLGVVSAIVGQTRGRGEFTGMANHAGTTPMQLRHDALAAAAEWIVAVERTASMRDGVIATVGKIVAMPGAANVIPGSVIATLDVRHADDAVRAAELEEILLEGQRAGERRGVGFAWAQTMDQKAVAMDGGLTDLLELATRNAVTKPVRMVSGAGHDAMIVAAKVPSCMLFLRSPCGLSHHPGEAVRAEDVDAAIATGMAFLKSLGERYGDIEYKAQE